MIALETAGGVALEGQVRWNGTSQADFARDTKVVALEMQGLQAREVGEGGWERASHAVRLKAKGYKMATCAHDHAILRQAVARVQALILAGVPIRARGCVPRTLR